MIVILDFGSQYTQLIARRVREAKVYCEILPFRASLDEIKSKKPSGIILSGGPSSVYAADAPRPDAGVWELGMPVLGICYGMQLMTEHFGGRVKSPTIANTARRKFSWRCPTESSPASIINCRCG